MDSRFGSALPLGTDEGSGPFVDETGVLYR